MELENNSRSGTVRLTFREREHWLIQAGASFSPVRTFWERVDISNRVVFTTVRKKSGQGSCSGPYRIDIRSTTAGKRGRHKLLIFVSNWWSWRALLAKMISDYYNWHSPHAIKPFVAFAPSEVLWKTYVRTTHTMALHHENSSLVIWV